jgi:hypothetical protein
MRSEPGQELFCKAHSHRFAENGTTVQQGVLSYFASRSLTGSRTMQDWFQAITTALAANHDLPPLARPQLQLQGSGDTPSP